MNLINKIAVYADTLKRLELKQLFYILINRVIKPHLPIFLIHSNRDVIDFKETKFRNDLLFGFVKKWEISKDSLINEDIYYIGIKKNISDKKFFYKLNLNDFDEKDPEILNNLYRFHLMAEILNEMQVKPEDKVETIVTWIDNVPVSRNSCWNGFNTSLRLINWIKILGSLNDEFQPDVEKWRKIISSVIIHLKIIRNNIEHQIPGNHVLIQYFSLWFACHIFPKWYKSGKYIEWSEKKLYKEINKEFQNDGLHFEYSVHYQIEVTLLSMVWLYGFSKLNKEINTSIQNKIENAYRLINCFLFPDGTIPMIGDNCYTFLNSSLKEDVKMCDMLGNILFKNRGDDKNFNDYLIDCNVYKIFQSGDLKIIFDTGNISYKASPGHGHSDLLSIIYFDKEPLFIDPGTRTYENIEQSLLQKKTISHNTLSIDSEDQALLWGFFRWSFLPTGLIQKSYKNDHEIVLIAEYKGFKKLGNFKHEREVLFDGERLTLKDNLTGEGVHDIIINFVLAPDITLVEKQEVIALIGKQNKWELSINSKNKYEIFKSSIDIFPAYNVERLSNKLSIGFKSVVLPFFSEIKVLRAPYD